MIGISQTNAALVGLLIVHKLDWSWDYFLYQEVIWMRIEKVDVSKRCTGGIEFSIGLHLHSKHNVIWKINSNNIIRFIHQKQTKCKQENFLTTERIWYYEKIRIESHFSMNISIASFK